MIRVTCAIILHKNKFLITQHGPDSAHPLKWEFPGGKIKTGESAENCIQREIKEELEIEIEILKRFNPVQFDYGFKKIELIPFLCSAKSTQIKLNNHIQYKWIQLNEIVKIDWLEADKIIIGKPEIRKFLLKHLGEQMNKSR